MKRVGYLWVLIAFCLFTTRPALAWWTVLYPDAAMEVTVDGSDTENEESKQPKETRQSLNGKQDSRKSQTKNEKADSQEEQFSGETKKTREFTIQWKLAEWLGKWF